MFTLALHKPRFNWAKYCSCVLGLALIGSTLPVQAQPDNPSEHRFFFTIVKPGYDNGENKNHGEGFTITKHYELPAPQSLSGISIYYTDQVDEPGSLKPIFEFENGLGLFDSSLNLASKYTDQYAENVNYTYDANLNREHGLLELREHGKTIDSLCWGKAGCLDPVKTLPLDRDAYYRTWYYEPFRYMDSYMSGRLSRIERLDPNLYWEVLSNFDKELLDKARKEREDAANQSPTQPTEPSDNTSTQQDPSAPATPTVSKCNSIRIKEILSYPEAGHEQFIEFANLSDQAIDATGCQVRYYGRTKTLNFTIKANGLLAISGVWNLPPINLEAQNLELLDEQGKVLQTIALPIKNRENGALAEFRPDEWQITYKPTPGTINTRMETRFCPGWNNYNAKIDRCVPDLEPTIPAQPTSKPCPAGSYRNPSTNRCKRYPQYTPTPSKAQGPQQTQPICPKGSDYQPRDGKCYKKVKLQEPPKELPRCPVGQFRNPATNRCKKIVYFDGPNGENNDPSKGPVGVSRCQTGYAFNPETKRCRKIKIAQAQAELKPCRAGYERNPETNRCRKIVTATTRRELKPCQTGYERNPETNRCRKIMGMTNSETNYPIKPNESTSKAFNWWWVVLAVGLATIISLIAGAREHWAKLKSNWANWKIYDLAKLKTLKHQPSKLFTKFTIGR